MEGVRRDVEAEEVEGFGGMQEARAEEGRRLPGGEGQRHQEREADAQCPEHDQDRPHPSEHGPGLPGLQAPQAGDEGDDHVRQDRHLEEPYVRIGQDLEGRRQLPQEEAEGHPRDEADQDLARQAQGSPSSPAPSGTGRGSTFQMSRQ
jgi:hypothetical protein